MISKYLLEPEVEDLYVWENGDRISIYSSNTSGVEYFYNGKDCIISKFKFPYLIFSMSEDYRKTNVLND